MFPEELSLAPPPPAGFKGDALRQGVLKEGRTVQPGVPGWGWWLALATACLSWIQTWKARRTGLGAVGLQEREPAPTALLQVRRLALREGRARPAAALCSLPAAARVGPGVRLPAPGSGLRRQLLAALGWRQEREQRQQVLGSAQPAPTRLAGPSQGRAAPHSAQERWGVEVR